jgi:uncharacterized damage-inducible protein DinB
MTTKEIYLMLAKHNQDVNNKVCGIISKLSREDREKDRGNYYGSLSSLTGHILGGMLYFFGLFRSALPSVSTALELPKSVIVPEGGMSDDQWKEFCVSMDTAGRALLNFSLSLKESDLKVPVKVDWFGGTPPSLPINFMFHRLYEHGTHHRGQVAQILDEMKVDNDFSAISIEFLPKL